MNKILYTLFAAMTIIFSSCISHETEISMIPYPNEISVGKGSFKAAGVQVGVSGITDPLSVKHIQDFAKRLTVVTGKPCNYSETAVRKGFNFIYDGNVGPEAYTLEITEKEAVVTASDAKGFLNAIMTIGQLLPAEYFGKTAGKSVKWVLPCLSIKDAPRFGYRGMHLDVSRHFFGVEEVKRYLDLLAMYKMNVFHWHLTDDQGWRIQIDKYPRLTETGAFRDSTIRDAHRGTDNGYDNRRYGGFYTKDQIRDIVAYAKDLGISIMPEVDLPGHMVAALASYPELGCTGGPYKVMTEWDISDDVLCPGKEATFTFIEDVLTEIMELFPSEYIGIGGDECPKVRWEKCPDCQRRIRELGLKDKDGITAEQYLQNYVTARVQKFVNDHGRKIVGWDEILEGDLAEGATVMSWRGVKGGLEAAKKGFDVIMTPNSYLYLDYYQTKERIEEPFCIGGYLPIDTVYAFDPYAGMDEAAAKHVLGVQANLWTEYIDNTKHLYYNLLPRQAALAEIQWCDAGNRDFERFKNAVRHQFEIYDVMGYPYCKAIFGGPSISDYGGLKGEPRGSVTNLDVADFEKYISDGNVQLVDVRTADEYNEGHIGKAVNIDFYSDSFEETAVSSLDRSRPVAVYCRSGRRSASAADVLKKNGSPEKFRV